MRFVFSIVYLVLANFPVMLLAQVVNVIIDPAIKKYIGDLSAIDRSKYFNIHDITDDVELKSFYSEYNVSKGRSFWGPAGFAVQKTGQVGVYLSEKSTSSTSPKKVNRWISTEHANHIYKEGIDTYLLSNWVIEYFKNFVDDNSRPMYYEPMNEPFVKARTFYDEPDWYPVAEDRVKREMSNVIKQIAQKIHQTPELAGMKVMGYAAAWPEFERDNFANWESNMQMFLDVAGEEMDAISYHLYDGVNIIGTDQRRSGSNVEAIMDLVETYSNYKWGYIKPHAITEYGATDAADYYERSYIMQSVRSQNHMIFQLMDRENNMEISIPFTVAKAPWHIIASNNYKPYHSVLFEPVPIGVPVTQIEGWIYNDRINFYKLWQNVRGDRVEIKSNNPDVQAQAFLDQNKMYVALNNLDDSVKIVDVNLAGHLPSVENVTVKSLKIYKDKPAIYDEVTFYSMPQSIILEYGETVVIEVNYSSGIEYVQSNKKTRYYSTKYLQAIKKNTQISFTFNDVITSNYGYASLSMGIGRLINKSKSPIVLINGVQIQVPNNWKGYDQNNRNDFFGVIEIPFPIELLKNNNTVSIQFPENGGHVSSVILNVEILSDYFQTHNIFPDVLSVENIYPNPSEGMVRFVGLKLNTKVQFYSIDGILKKEFFYMGNDLDINNLDKGAYFVKTNNKLFRLVKN